MGTLNDILNEESEPQAVEPVIEPTPEPTAAEPVQPVRDDKGRFAPKGEEESVSPAPVEEPQFDHAAVKAERSRRQAAEQRLQALEQQLQALQTPATPPPSVFEDEEGWQQHFGSQIAQQAAFNARLDTSEMLASQAHEDFDDMKAKFLEMAQANPALGNQALEAKHPWEKAYQIARNAVKMEELGAVNVSDLETKLREKITAELAAAQPQPATPQLPTSLAETQSARNNSGIVASGPPSLAQILGR